MDFSLSDLHHWWTLIPGAVKAVAGAAAGTLFGAWLTGRAQQRREIISELRALRSANALAVAIANQCLALRKQHVVPLKGALDEARDDFDLYVAGPKTVPFNIQFELHTLPDVHTPIEALEKLAFEKCDLGFKGIAATAELTSALKALNATNGIRNDLLRDLRANASISDQDILFRYLGLRDPDTQKTDERYKGAVEALDLQTKDCIFFAGQLAAECVRHANSRAKRHRWKYPLPYRRLEPADWTKVIEAGLMPDKSEYTGWLTGFREEKKTNWWRNMFIRK